jgi:hypothetical protein
VQSHKRSDEIEYVQSRYIQAERPTAARGTKTALPSFRAHSIRAVILRYDIEIYIHQGADMLTIVGLGYSQIYAMDTDSQTGDLTGHTAHRSYVHRISHLRLRYRQCIDRRNQSDTR